MNATQDRRNAPADRLLDAVSRRWRFRRNAQAALLGTAFALSGGLFLCALDNLLRLGAGTRIGLLAAFLVGLAASVLQVLLRRAPDRLEAAVLVERGVPGLDNRLVNVERLAREATTPEIVLDLLRAEAAPVLEAVEPRSLVTLERLRPIGWVAGAALVLAILYAALLPHYLANAAARFAFPGRFTPPITRTRLTVSPGDVRLVEGASLEIRAKTEGAIPETARVRIAGVARDMRFLGGDFVLALENVTEPFDYAVEAGDAESPVFHVSVQKPARIAKLVARYEYPDYLGWAPRTDERSSGNLSAVEGTRVTLDLEATKPLASLRVVATDPSLPALAGTRWTFVLARSASYHFEWKDAEGLIGRSATYALVAVRDLPPSVKLASPATGLAVRADAELTAVAVASDDFGLARLELRATVGQATSSVSVAALDLAAPGVAPKRDVRTQRPLSLASLGAKPGDTIALVAVARDTKGQETSSSVVLINVQDEKAAREQLEKELQGLVARLRRVVLAQRRIHDDTVAGQVAVPALAAAQAAVLETLVQIHAGWNEPDLKRLAARSRLEAAIRGPATLAVEQVRSNRALAGATQMQLVSELEAIIAALEELVQALEKGDLAKALAAASEKSPRDKAKELLAGLKEFVAEQTKVLEDTKALSGKRGDDFTEEQKKQLELLKQTEEKWGKYLAEKATDLSKVPPQDFSNGSVSKDLAAASSEVDQAAAQLAQKAVEVAVPMEQSGLELAKEITENIERWLATAPDNTRWVMEEPKGPSDVPMADLPQALEDLMGDLLDKEDKLAQDSQDVTSSWMDSMDKGVGWGVGDGPISNMSAKGVTGNLQPNSNEIAGRSGEGRSGKSSGQMVGDTAVGKGGKETPTRLTPDAYEAGRVKDASRDAQGGSTGGGKVSGSSKEGLRGQAPPPIADKMDRLADRQADIRSTAEKAKVALERKGYVSEDLARTLERMKLLEAELRAKKGANFTAEAKAISEELAALKRTVRDDLDVTRDPARGGSRSAREELSSARDEDIPPEFRDSVKEYYRALSEGEAKR